MHSNHRRKRKKLKADINVVPYIDVMLVLLIIFMVTAPLLNLGVDIELPESEVAKTLNVQKDPFVVSIDAQGKLYLTIPNAPREEIDEAGLLNKFSAFAKQNPKLTVYVAGDGQVQYSKVYDAMALLQRAGVPKVGLMGQPPQEPKR
ncbi:protein TolR [Tahibacter amnicola]|uniref:Tol-Pal system protein TolR n=1 Tax=Tahibacter amnicola TaxID=2976241 RepID=A0ABY6BCA0_9GAMM|nr:protein TolR [Tahibacter amnicola]UXI67669.1 protein TolR [Tahibacter amnicola]